MSLEESYLSNSDHDIEKRNLQSYSQSLSLQGKGKLSTVFFASYESYISEDIIEEIKELIAVGMVEVTRNYISNLSLYEWTIKVTS